MNISEVEHIVGLSKKSIRYYEEHGLLHPKRNDENDYRIFSDEDIHKLKIIKFFRELGISIHDLKKTIQWRTFVESVYGRAKKENHKPRKKLSKSKKYV